jgi:hypothetical protein
VNSPIRSTKSPEAFSTTVWLVCLQAVLGTGDKSPYPAGTALSTRAVKSLIAKTGDRQTCCGTDQYMGLGLWRGKALSANIRIWSLQNPLLQILTIVEPIPKFLISNAGIGQGSPAVRHYSTTGRTSRIMLVGRCYIIAIAIAIWGSSGRYLPRT